MHPESRSESGAFPTLVAKRKAVSRARKALPFSSNKCGDVLAELVHTASHNKQNSENKKRVGLYNLTYLKLRSELRILKAQRDFKLIINKRVIVCSLLISKKYRLMRTCSKELDIRSKFPRKCRLLHKPNSIHKRKTRPDMISTIVIKTIRKFYEREDVSRILPCMMTVSKKTQVQMRVMEITIKQAHTLWEKVHPVSPISESLFQRNRPSHAMTQQNNSMIQCLCEYCTNVSLKLSALNKAMSSLSKQDTIKDKGEHFEMTLFSKPESDTYFSLGCIRRECKNCGLSRLEDHLYELFEDSTANQISWKVWETSHNTTTNIGVETQKKKNMLVSKTESVASLIDELQSEVDSLSLHLFIANWQHAMFKTISSKLPDGWVVTVLDFAENYTCTYQDKIQSAHWAHNQVTFHPVVAYYTCYHDEGSHITQEAIVFISNDLKHDTHAVCHFTKVAVHHLKEKRGVRVTQEIQFTDGCVSLNKSKGSFCDISYAKVELGHQ